jgi:hypothetical protein
MHVVQDSFLALVELAPRQIMNTSDEPLEELVNTYGAVGTVGIVAGSFIFSCHQDDKFTFKIITEHFVQIYAQS